MMEFFKSIFILYCAVYATRWVAIKIIIWFRLRRLVRPYYGPTINDHERRLRKDIGKVSEHRAALAQKNKAEHFDHFKVHGAFFDHDINPTDYLNDPMYSSMLGNIYYTDDSYAHGNDNF